MQWKAYQQAWSYPAVRHAALLGFLGKAPWFGASIILTLHVVDGLGQTYAAAGLLTAVFTLALAISSPWRGRLLDTVGLRRTLAPSLIVLPLISVAAPFANYWALMVGMAVVGALAVPWFVVTRQIVIAAVPAEHRRTAIALDSVLTELAFVAGPALGVVAAVWWETRWALPAFLLASILGAGLLAWVNPPLSDPTETARDSEEPPTTRRGLRTWINGPVAATFVASTAIAFTLAGTDLAIVAATRAMDAVAMMAVILAIWGAGSALGGLLYGATKPGSLPLPLLVVILGLTTLAGSLGVTPWLLAAIMAVAGLFCAPSLAAAAEQLSHAVVERYRGEALGWQGTFSTVGNAMAPPLVGWFLDHVGWQAGFLVTGGVGLLIGGIGAFMLTAARQIRRKQRAAVVND